MNINSFIHPDLHDPVHKQYRMARILVGGMLILSILFIPYCLYFYFAHSEDTFKNITNLAGILFFILLLLAIRKCSNLTYLIVVANLISSSLTMVSILATGGIFSADISWFLLSNMCLFFFTGKKWGIISCIYLISWTTYFYYLEINQTDFNTFKNYVITHDSTHYYFTWVFIFILAAALVYAFISILDNTNLKLEQLSNEKITDLEKMVSIKTNEISQLRSNLAKDFHDEMGNNLTSISVLAQSLIIKTKQNANEEEIEQMLKTIEQKSNELYIGTKDFIWSIDFKSDYANEFYIYLRDFGEVFFGNMEIDFLAENNLPSDNSLKLTATVGRQLLFICKEIMNNAAKYAKATEIIFSISAIENQTLVCCISDNGIGFDLENVKKRGLNNIYKRAETSKISINLKTDTKKGTIFMIHVPMFGDILIPTQNG